MKILVTGATGYVSGRLIPQLLATGHEVRVLVRDPKRVSGRPWTDKVEIVQGDLLNGSNLLEAAFKDIDVAYYLVHSMLAGRGFDESDRDAANNFADAAWKVRHVIYLGGLLPRKHASRHLRSR